MSAASSLLGAGLGLLAAAVYFGYKDAKAAGLFRRRVRVVVTASGYYDVQVLRLRGWRHVRTCYSEACAIDAARAHAKDGDVKWRS